MMDYRQQFVKALDRVRAESRYRSFAEIERSAGRFPAATWHRPGGATEITVWCSNDYLGMSQHPAVVGAMSETASRCGVGAGGTRNISGTSRAIVALEAELADLHGKEDALVFSSGYVSNVTGDRHHRGAAARVPDPVGRRQPQLDDRGRAPLGRREGDLPPQRHGPSGGAPRGGRPA